MAVFFGLNKYFWVESSCGYCRLKVHTDLKHQSGACSTHRVARLIKHVWIKVQASNVNAQLSTLEKSRAKNLGLLILFRGSK